MFAIVLAGAGGPEVLVAKDVPDPVMSLDDVTIRVRATAINRADLMQRDGNYPPPPDAPKDILGLEYSGEVTAVGARVRNVTVGDRVFGLAGGGTYAENLCVPAETVVKMPAGLSFEDAAALPEATITAYDAIVSQGLLAAGESLLISAVGSGVGTAAVQIAKAIGARSIGTSRTADKLARAKELGLDVGICVQNATFSDAVLDATEGRGADVILELVGGPYLAEDLRAVAAKGRIVLVGLTGGSKGELDFGLILRKRLKLTGTVLRARPPAEKIAAMKMFERHLVPLIARGQLRAIIHETHSLRDENAVRTAHANMAKNGGIGKYVLTVD